MDEESLMTLGAEVRFKYMPLTGTIVAYNKKPGIFGFEHFPYMIRRSDGTLRAHAEDDFSVIVMQAERMPAPVKEEVSHGSKKLQ